MSEKELLGRFETTTDSMQKILRWAHAPFDESYNQAYLNLASGELRTVANAGQSVVAYCDFTAPFLKDIELHDDVDVDAGMQAVVRVPQIQQYLEFVGGDKLIVEFYGNADGENRADKIALEGDLRAEIYLPSSEKDYESKQLKIVQIYNEDDEWVKPSTIPDDGDVEDGEPLQTSFTTEAQQFNSIIQAVSFENFALANYPVVIEDGEFMLNASDENNRDKLYGQLEAENVEGPDVNNTYSRGFEQLFENISGEVQISVEDDAPISIVRENGEESMTLRYSILPTTS